MSASSRHIIIVGGSVTGLGLGLALTRDQHRVTILESDTSPMPESHFEAFATWERRGAPQVRHSHAFLARLYNLIRDHAPELLEKLLACGATELRFHDMARRLIPDPEFEPEDENIVLLACRRVTFEWVLRRHILDTGRVEFHDAVAVQGLEAERDAATGLPRVTGVRMRDRDGRMQLLSGDLVVDASGRRSDLKRWLEEIGTPPVREESEPCGIFYTSRYYRLRDGVEPPPLDGPIVGEDLGYLKVGLFPGDGRIFSLTLAASPDDDVLRSVVHRRGFEAVAQALPKVAGWIDPEVSEPISDVHAMADLRNTRRYFVEDGRPLALGVVAIGDALLHQNPITGRGCSLGWVAAFMLADLLQEPSGDLMALALALDEGVERELVPWHQLQLQQDRDALELSQAQIRGEDPFQLVRQDGTNDPKAFMRSVLREGLLPAIRTDLVVMRRFMRLMNLLDQPKDLMKDSDLMQRVLAVYQNRNERPPESEGPRRREMVEILRAAAA